MKISLNLASRRYLNRRALYGCYTVAIVALVLTLGVNLNLYLRSHQETVQLKGRMAELERELTGEQETAVAFNPKAYSALLEEIAFANDVLIQDSFRWTRLLDRLEEVTPKKVLISRIQPSFKEQTLELVGQTRSVDDLRRFIDNLIASPHFEDVYLFNQARVLSGKGRRGAGGNITYTIRVKGGF